jgi:hypothetical protein
MEVASLTKEDGVDERMRWAGCYKVLFVSVSAITREIFEKYRVNNVLNVRSFRLFSPVSTCSRYTLIRNSSYLGMGIA